MSFKRALYSSNHAIRQQSYCLASHDMHYLLNQNITMPSHVKVNQFQFRAQLPKFSLARSAFAFIAQVVLLGVIALGTFLPLAAAAQNIFLTTISDPCVGVS